METNNVSVAFSWLRPAEVGLLTRQDHPEFFAEYDLRTSADSYDREDSLLVAPLTPRWMTSEPLDDSKLLGKFALLEPQLGDIVTLAREFGFLRQTPNEMTPGNTLEINGKSVLVEGVSEWQHFLPFVHIALSMQYAVKYPGRLEIAAQDIMHRWPGVFRNAWINCNGVLTKVSATAVEVQRFYNSLLSLTDLTPSLTFTAVQSGSSYQMQLRPSNLRQAIETQMIRTATGVPGLHRCTHCHMFFTAAGHKDRMYCSNACKQAASRERQQLPSRASATTVQQPHPNVAS